MTDKVILDISKRKNLTDKGKDRDESMICFPAGKVVRLRQKLSDITGAVTGIFGRKAEKDPAVARLDALKV